MIMMIVFFPYHILGDLCLARGGVDSQLPEACMIRLPPCFANQPLQTGGGAIPFAMMMQSRVCVMHTTYDRRYHVT